MKNRKFTLHPGILICCLILIKFLLARLLQGHPTDIMCFSVWSDKLGTLPPSEFYLPADYFADYPPGYMLVLFIIGRIKNILHITYDSALFNLMLKAPAILADVLLSYIIYKLLKKRSTAVFATNIMILVALNPVLIINSSWWGQIDSFFTLFLILAVLALYKNKVVSAIGFYTICATIKPQAFLFAPIFIVAFFSCKSLKTMLKSIAISIAVFLITLIPFRGLDIIWLIQKYAGTLSSYAYATVNADNLYMLLGMNWADISSNIFLKIFNIAVIVSTTLGAGFICIKMKDKSKYLLAAAFTVTILFNFATKMHERYIFPALIALAVYYALNQKREILILLIANTISQFISSYRVLYNTLKLQLPGLLAHSASFVSLLNLIIFGYLVYFIIIELKRDGEKSA